MTKAEMAHLLDKLANSLIGSDLCDHCNTIDGVGCRQEGQCYFLMKQRSSSNDSIINPWVAKELALKWQNRNKL